MSTLKVKQLTQRLVSKYSQHIDMRGIKDTDSDREDKIQTRCLAALAIQSSSGCSEEDAAKSVWDGSDDNGIDAAYYNHEESEVTIVQSKFIKNGNGEPSAKDVSVFIDGINDLIETDIDSFHDDIKLKAQAIIDRLLEPGTTINVVLISTGASELAVHSRTKIEKFLKKFNGEESSQEDCLIRFTCIGFNEVFSYLANESSLSKPNIVANILEWSNIPKPYNAYFGIIDGTQLKNWWQQYGKKIVAKNIRHALGQTEVNQQIQNTGSDYPQHFWYFNNGITLIADEATRAPASSASKGAGIFEFKGASIVNGAQTVSSLSKIEDDEALGKTRVSIRVIILKDAPANFGLDVTRTNNLQNRIEGRDFVASDPQQERIKSEMGIENVTYQIHRSEDYIASDRSCDLIEVTTALACAHDAAMAVAVKTGIGRFYNDLSKAPYKTIFNPSTNGARAFNSVRILRYIERWISDKKTSTERRSGYSWGILIHGNRSIAASVFKHLDSSMLNVPVSELPTDTEQMVNEICDIVYNRMLEKLNSDFPNKALAVLFKNPTACKEIHETV